MIKHSTDVATLDRVEIREPNMWNVILHNDDTTPMYFVVQVLLNFFHMDPRQAIEVMLGIHKTGQAVVGTYTHEIAEDKANQTMQAARQEGFPLTATIEENI